MHFNLSTFVLELINFLILVWILQRFLYKPVLEVIDRRRARIDKSLTDAKDLHGQAEALEQKYSNRLSHWEQEKKSALENLHQEIEKERSQQMCKLEEQLEEQYQKAQVNAERHLEEMQARSEKLAMEQGARFASLLLKHTAGPELESRLFELLLYDLDVLSTSRIQSLQMNNGSLPDCIQISSVYQLSQEKRVQLERTINGLIELSLPYDYLLEPGLIAGFRICIGPWVLQANVQNEMSGFVEINNAKE